MPNVQTIVETGSNDDKIALVQRAEAAFVTENIGFLFAVLNYRDQVNNPGQVAPVPIPISAIRGVVPGDLNVAQQGLWIFNHYVRPQAQTQVNLSYDCAGALTAISQHCVGLVASRELAIGAARRFVSHPSRRVCP